MKKIWLTAATSIALLAFAAPIIVVATDEDFVEFAANDEDMFLDEGDADFSTMQPASGTEPTTADAPPANEAPMPPSNADADDVMSPEPAGGGSPAFAEPSNEAPTDEGAPEPTKKAKKAKKPVAKAEPKKKAPKAAAKKAKGGAGMFVVTKDACPMMREPASESEPMITVKPSKKIWVESVDDQWVRGFNKAGEGGYISRDCVE